MIEKSNNFLKDYNYILSANPPDFEFVNSIKYKNIVTIVGTQSYKNVNQAMSIYKLLKLKELELKFCIISEHNFKFRSDEEMIIFKNLNRKKVIEILNKSKYYINASIYENSFNNALEGIFSSQYSYISDIEVHRELLEKIKYPLKKKYSNFFFIEKNKIPSFKFINWNQDCKLLINKINEF